IWSIMMFGAPVECSTTCKEFREQSFYENFKWRDKKMERQKDRGTEGRRDRGTEGQKDGEKKAAAPLFLSVSPSLCPPVLLSLRLLLLLTVVLTGACLLKASKPNLPAIFPAPIVANQTGKPPIIFIPGITASELVDRTTGVKLWPDLFPENKAAL